MGSFSKTRSTFLALFTVGLGHLDPEAYIFLARARMIRKQWHSSEHCRQVLQDVLQSVLQADTDSPKGPVGLLAHSVQAT
eukprot:15008973-Alexandrium_andersonii.AAC.1